MQNYFHLVDDFLIFQIGVSFGFFPTLILFFKVKVLLIDQMLYNFVPKKRVKFEVLKFVNLLFSKFV